ncbi:hypothetical protein PTTG_28290 [Puccinia triticina 1-1 BBBD Race 1]|uniref:Uncharacterized protein n=1 Tax=Puccinia triticina (isolate 1-1 / race 1 (BBBD)) TaxID=630390 RepID=A0A180GCL2_PUCT1|nr:hypothetical protein PTTG_28290 [Puccinia triticina 1-1 BBBD Race 1]
MSDVSEMAPITPLQNSPRFSPSPPQAANIPIPSTPHQSSFFAIGSGQVPLQGPSQSGGQPVHLFSSQNLGIPGHTEDDISALLSNLRVDNSNQSSLIEAQAASIALLTVQARQDKKSINLLQAKTKNIKDVFHGELMKTQAENQQSLAHLRGLMEGSNTAFGG